MMHLAKVSARDKDKVRVWFRDRVRVIKVGAWFRGRVRVGD